jgi:Tfp pilus assembly protein PilF
LCARVAHKKGDCAAERARLDGALAKNASDVDARLMRAWMNGQEGRLADAVADYNGVIEARPDFAAALNNRAWVKVEQGDFAGARADPDRAVALAPDEPLHLAHVSVKHWLGTRCFALAGLGDVAAARADARGRTRSRPARTMSA